MFAPVEMGAYLGLIQGVINRMAGNSFLLKGWSVTLVAGLSAFAAKDAKPAFALIAAGVAILFALLDSYYLAWERAYRNLYNAQATASDPSWSMAATRPDGGAYRSALGSVSVWPLHLVVVVAAVATAVLA